MTKFALLYHNTLDRQGVDLTSDEYYEKINKRMREVYPDEFGSTEPEPKNDAPANVVAAATRTTAPKTVRLTKSQQSIAKVLGLTLPQYAKQLAAEERKENV
jgi:hypothetical protein